MPVTDLFPKDWQMVQVEYKYTVYAEDGDKVVVTFKRIV